MPSAWKWKAGLFGGIVVLSLYFLAPTLFGFQELREESEATGVPLPWYASLFPQNGINLGLDLRGGIYIEFDVDLDDAIENKVDLIVDDLNRTLKGTVTNIRQDIANHTVMIETDGSGKTDTALEKVREDYSGVLILRSSSDTQAILALDEEYADYLKGMITKQALEKVHNRIDRYGVVEPSIQRLGENRIAVELPGVKDPDRAINLIKRAGNLEFKIVSDALSTAELTQLIAEAKKQEELPDDYSTTTALRLTELLKTKLPADTEISFERQFDPVAKKITGGVPYLLERKARVTGEMLKNAQTQVQNNEPYVSLTFDTQGTALFGETTQENVGKQLAILLDGVVNSAPVIREPILGGQAQITLGYGNYSDLLKECEDLVLVLQEGALPAKLTEATKTVVGPSLGADSIRKGIFATIVGCSIIFLFMLFYYKGSGLIANIALVFNLLLILSALALFQATLTLPGIAGIVLTLGMAIDSNILILERIREELRDGKQVRIAIDAGYQNALRTIIDSNVTTLIAGLVLYQFGTGPIKGFAVTLIIGLLISMYTACSCTRMAYDYLVTARRIQRISI